MTTLQIIDVDQHLFESRTTWSEYIDPAQRSDALSIADDDARMALADLAGQQLTPLEVPIPERSTLIGEDRMRRLRGERAPASFDELVPDSYRLAGARLASLDEFGLDAAVLFPNYGLLVGAAAGLGPRRAARQRAGLQPLRGRRVRRRAGPPLRGGPRAACTTRPGRSRRSGGCGPRASASP